MTELADWCACETLWLLRRGGREPRTLTVVVCATGEPTIEGAVKL